MQGDKSCRPSGGSPPPRPPDVPHEPVLQAPREAPQPEQKSRELPRPVVARLRKALQGEDEQTWDFILAVLELHGLLCPALPPPRATAREIERQARAAAAGDEVAPWVRDYLEPFRPRDPELLRRAIASAKHQRRRGGALRVRRRVARRPAPHPRAHVRDLAD